MRENRSRFVLVCQQLLALGTVLAVVAPAASVVTLDIVAPAPSSQGDQVAAALVSAEPVTPEVEEVPVRAVERAGLQALTPRAVAQEKSQGDLAALTAPQDVDGYATVGVTWSPTEHLDEDEVTVSVRSREDGQWSGWQQVEYHDDHGPDPDSEEARGARPGTEPIVVGDVDDVQIKIETPDGDVPEGARLAIIDPGTTRTAREVPAIDTAALGDGSGSVAMSSESSGSSESSESGADASLAAAETGELTALPAYVTAKPQIFSRAQWGANERLREASALKYFEVHAGFVHHTVNANNYTSDQVPALLRGIYAYHTQTRGWSDIGYNFVVDRFGRIWEGRYGGVDRPVVGAHTLNYNEYSFAMSALGNFDTAAPPAAMVDAYGRLFAWKLSLHGVRASSTAQSVGSRTFPAINGHRDAGQTACPGRYLYAALGKIRTLAAQNQRPFTSRTRSTNLAGTRWPDLVVRDRATQRAFVVRTGGQVGFRTGTSAASGWQGQDLLAPAGDFTGDRIPDLVARNASTKTTAVYPGTASGTFGAARSATQRFSAMDQLAGGVELTGDGKPDLVARHSVSKRLFVYPGNGRGGYLRRQLLSTSWGAYNLTTGAGDLTGDRKHDLVVRQGRSLLVVPGTAPGLGKPVAIPGDWSGYDLISGGGDLTGDGKADLVARAARSKLLSIFPGAGAGRLSAPLGPFPGFAGVNWIVANGNLVGSRAADLVGRSTTGAMLAFAHTGGVNVEAVTDTRVSFAGTDLILNVGDWNGDGRGDVVTRVTSTGVLQLRAGNGVGSFAPPVTMGAGWGAIGLLAAVGDVTGDGFPDLMGQPAGRAMRIYPGNGASGFGPSYVAHSAITATVQAGIGLWNADGSPDSLMRASDGSLVLYPGNGPGGLLNPTRVGGVSSAYDWLQAVGDANGDGRPDLLVREKSTGKLWLLPGLRNGFGARVFVAAGFGRYDLTSG